MQTVTDNELMDLLDRWSVLRQQLDLLEDQIEQRVAELGHSVNDHPIVRVSYSAGRGKYDWESVGKEAPEAVVQQFVVQRVDWRGVVKAMGWEDRVPYTPPEKPSITIKLKDA